jgi:hypothetical protein
MNIMFGYIRSLKEKLGERNSAQSVGKSGERKNDKRKR